MAHGRSCCLAALCLSATVLLADGAGAQDAVPASPTMAPPTGSPTAPVHAPTPAAPTFPTAPPIVPQAVPPGTLAAIGGDRADAIARDIMLHPPHRPGSQQESAQLHTINLKLNGLLDRSVHGSENTEVGRVIDVLIGDDGHPAALTLDVGGFMGVGNRKIAVAWALFDVAKPGNEPLRVALTEGQVKSAPTAEDAGEVTVVTGEGGQPAIVRPKAESEPVAASAAVPAPKASVSAPASAVPAPPVEPPGQGGAPTATMVPMPAARDPATSATPAVQPRHATPAPSGRR